MVEREVLKDRRGSGGQPWHFIDFQRGVGEAVTNEMDLVEDETQLQREQQTLKSPDILAIKGLAQFERFPTALALGTLQDPLRKYRYERDLGVEATAPNLRSAGGRHSRSLRLCF